MFLFLLFPTVLHCSCCGCSSNSVFNHPWYVQETLFVSALEPRLLWHLPANKLKDYVEKSTFISTETPHKFTYWLLGTTVRSKADIKMNVFFLYVCVCNLCLLLLKRLDFILFFNWINHKECCFLCWLFHLGSFVSEWPSDG